MTALVLLLAALAAPDPSGLSPAGASADRALLQEVFEERRISRNPGRAGLGEYAFDVMEQALDGLGRFLGPLADVIRSFLQGHPGFIPRVAVVLAVMALLATLAAVAFALASRGAARPAPPRDLRLMPAGAAARRAGGLDAAGWRAELEARLARGDVRGAIEAAWWWVAAAAAAGPPDPAWTTGELVRRAGRRDLAPAARELDRLAYARGLPGEGDVRALARRLDVVLA